MLLLGTRPNPDLDQDPESSENLDEQILNFNVLTPFSTAAAELEQALAWRPTNSRSGSGSAIQQNPYETILISCVFNAFSIAAAKVQ